MAKVANPVGEDPPKKSKKLLIISIAVALLLVVAGAGAVILLMSGDDGQGDEEDVVVPDKKPRKKKAGPEVPPVFVNLDAFTVNLVPEGDQGDQYMQVVIALELDDMSSDAALKNQMPRVRNNVTMILSSKKASQLLSKEGKEQLAKEIRDEINRILNPGTQGSAPETPVLSVLFTSFIIQ